MPNTFNSEIIAKFNDLEAAKLAIEVEREGLAFYRRHAAEACDPEVAAVLSKLAGEEEGHIERFSKLEADLLAEHGDGYYDGDEIGRYIGVIIDTSIFKGNKDLLSFLPKSKSRITPLRVAIQAEKDAILFYREAARNCQNAKGRQVFEEICHEECEHLDLLFHQLKTLESK